MKNASTEPTPSVLSLDDDMGSIMDLKSWRCGRICRHAGGSIPQGAEKLYGEIMNILLSDGQDEKAKNNGKHPIKDAVSDLSGTASFCTLFYEPQGHIGADGVASPSLHHHIFRSQVSWASATSA